VTTLNQFEVLPFISMVMLVFVILIQSYFRLFWIIHAALVLNSNAAEKWNTQLPVPNKSMLHATGIMAPSRGGQVHINHFPDTARILSLCDIRKRNVFHTPLVSRKF